MLVHSLFENIERIDRDEQVAVNDVIEIAGLDSQ